MAAFRTHIIHVGGMNNKGTQALFKSDVNVIKTVVKDAFISVSTTDINGVKRLNLPLEAVLPPVIDIPYERADQLAKKFGFGRGGLRYKGLTLAILLFMFVQAFLSVFSVFLAKIGVKACYRCTLIEYIKNCDLVISHSDENFKESASLLPLNPYWVLTWWSMLISRTWDILVAKSLGKPVVIFPNSIGPFRTGIGRFLSRLSLNNCDYILIRDPVSYEIVNGLGVKALRIFTFDTAILFSESKEGFSSAFPKPTIGVSPGVYSHSLSKEEVQNYIQAHARALDAAIEKHGFFVVFLPHYISGFSNDDLEISELTLEKMRNKSRARIVKTETVEDFKMYLDEMDIVLSSKMHPAVLAASGYVPVLCIAYDHKQTGFFHRLGMDDCTLNIRMVSYESLLSGIDHVWNHKEKLRISLKNRIPRWQEDVKSVIEQVVTSYIKQDLSKDQRCRIEMMASD